MAWLATVVRENAAGLMALFGIVITGMFGLLIAHQSSVKKSVNGTLHELLEILRDDARKEGVLTGRAEMRAEQDERE
jgi:hypothetical protein